MQNQLFELALGVAKPWYVNGVDFDAAKKTLTIGVDFVAGTRFATPGVALGDSHISECKRRSKSALIRRPHRFDER